MSEIVARLPIVPAEVLTPTPGLELPQTQIVAGDERAIISPAALAQEALAKIRIVGAAIGRVVLRRQPSAEAPTDAESLPPPPENAKPFDPPALQSVLDRIAQATTEAEQAKDDELKFGDDPLITQAMLYQRAGGQYTPSELHALFDGLAVLNETAMVTNEVWRYLDALPDGVLQRAFNNHNGAFTKILDRSAIYHGGNKDFVRLVARAVGDQYGDISEWHHGMDERGVMPDSLRSIVGQMGFERGVGLDLVIEKAERLKGAEQVQYLRDAERTILKNMGFSDEVSHDFRLAISQRTMKKDKEGWTIPISEGGKVNTGEWKGAVSKLYAHSASLELGVKNLTKLYEECGIVNFDYYSHDQLLLMKNFVDRDEATLARLRKLDTAVMITDAFGDHNGGYSHATKGFENSTTMLYFEVRKPSDFYRPFIKMRSRGILPSTAFITMHGSPDCMQFGADGNSYAVSRYKGKRQFRMRDLNIDRIASNYMRPHSQAGVRSVVLHSCSQARRYDLGASNARILARRFKPRDRVVVSAYSRPGYFSRLIATGEPRFSTNGSAVDTHEFRNAGRLHRGVRHTKTQRILGVE